MFKSAIIAWLLPARPAWTCEIANQAELRAISYRSLIHLVESELQSIDRMYLVALGYPAVV